MFSKLFSKPYTIAIIKLHQIYFKKVLGKLYLEDQGSLKEIKWCKKNAECHLGKWPPQDVGIDSNT